MCKTGGIALKIELEKVLPAEIEKRSFEIITEELQGRAFLEDQELIIKRVIHTTADFEYADNLKFSEGAVSKAIEAIKSGACIVTDTQMAKAELIRSRLPNMEVKYIALCLMTMWH